MNHLESYFQNEYVKDSSELNEVDNVLKKVIPTFYIAFDNKKNAWPYKIDDKQENITCENYSVSTNSMILVMMDLCDNNIDRKNIFPDIQSEKISNCITYNEEKWEKVKNCAIAEITTKLIKKDNDILLTDSSTYGANDPLSLLWCLELIEKHDVNDLYLNDKTNDKIKKIVTDKYKNITGENILTFYNFDYIISKGSINLNGEIINWPESYNKKHNNKNPERNKHSFISLRLLQLVKKIGIPEDQIDETFNFFEQRLHLHLSYSEIPDSRFDPAELVFSLEGALRTKGVDSVSHETIERAFLILEQCQDFTPYWRPVNPIYATAQGQILLPLSVEVGNSLLRVCSLLDKGFASKDCPFSKHADMFKRYFRWLKAQMRQIKVMGETCCGWASEHVGGDNEIHLFQTSEIMCFLVNYRHMLQDRIARRSLMASGLKVDFPKRNIEHADLCRSTYWDRFVEPDFEPLLEDDVPSELKIYTQIGNKFINPRNEEIREGAPSYSILLYGPPGTGKSTVGENIAKTLGWRFITVTPSDFLAGGAGEVEARAKFIFKCLEEQKDAVILFDEIDHFLIDRESNEYKLQTGIFQFMTPGMLPKINDLRKRERSIFIIATNYEERIDPAIKRSGRIDIKLPLMPPALKQRCKTINKNNLFLTPEHTAGCTYNDITKDNGTVSIKEKHYDDRLGIETITAQNNNAAVKTITKKYEKIPIIEYLLLSLIKNQNDRNKLSLSAPIEIGDFPLIWGHFKPEIGENNQNIMELFKIYGDGVGKQEK
ncbi:MAG: ATP-binding protein [Desulfobulbus sp.]|nr:ATP-binding protein [Desulfobulbus sp.]